MTRTAPRRSVLISGASIAGPALAFWLNRHGYEVTVVEKAGTLRSGGYPALRKIICRYDLNVLFYTLSSVTNTPRHN